MCLTKPWGNKYEQFNFYTCFLQHFYSVTNKRDMKQGGDKECRLGRSWSAPGHPESIK